MTSRLERQLTLYMRAGCPLCEEMAEQVRARADAYRMTAVDVDADPALKPALVGMYRCFFMAKPRFAGMSLMQSHLERGWSKFELGGFSLKNQAAGLCVWQSSWPPKLQKNISG